MMRIAALYDIHGNLDALEAVLADETAPAADDPWGALRHWAARQLTADQRAFLAALPTSVSRDVPGLGAVLFCHGTPRSDEEIITRLTGNG